MRETLYDIAEHGIPGWHLSTADGHSRLSGYAHNVSDIVDRLAPGAIIIDKEPIWESDTFISDVLRSPMVGPDRRGAFLEALREAPYMIAAVESYGLVGATAAQATAERDDPQGYGPMDTAPPEFHAGYWADRGADVWQLP